MFQSYYVSTRDRKNHEHNYRLPKGEGVPAGHEITNLSVAGRFSFADILGEEQSDLLRYAFGVKKNRKKSRA